MSEQHQDPAEQYQVDKAVETEDQAEPNVAVGPSGQPAEGSVNVEGDAVVNVGEQMSDDGDDADQA